MYYSTPVDIALPFTMANANYYAMATAAAVGSNVGWTAGMRTRTTTQVGLSFVRNGNTGTVSADIYINGQWK